MIGETKTDIDNDNGFPRWCIPIRDAIILGFISLLSQLATQGYPPSEAVIYSSFLAAALTALVSYAHSVGIRRRGNP